MCCCFLNFAPPHSFRNYGNDTMNNKFISWGIFILLCFIWGSSFILMKASKEDLTASQIASLRIFSAGLVFLPFAVFHISKIPRKKMFLIILTGLFGNLFPAFLYAIAIAKNTDSSLAGILNSLTPICVVVVGILFFRDKIKAQKIIGVFVGFAGLLLLTLTQKNISLENFGYALLIVLATLFYGININLVGHYLKEENPVHVATVSIAFMVIPTGFVLWQQGFLQLDFSNSDLRWAVVASVLLGIAGTAIATALFYILVKKAGGLFASLVTYGIPFVALFWGFVYGEGITIMEIGCLLVILLGVYLANRPERIESAKPDPEREKIRRP
jgi:drug/metabolite transporter (DMT)-like permease